MLDKLEQIETRYEELTQELSSPELLSNPSQYGKVAKQHRALGEVVEKYRALRSLTRGRVRRHFSLRCSQPRAAKECHDSRSLKQAVCGRMTTALSARRPSAGAVPGRRGLAWR